MWKTCKSWDFFRKREVKELPKVRFVNGLEVAIGPFTWLIKIDEYNQISRTQILRLSLGSYNS